MKFLNKIQLCGRVPKYPQTSFKNKSNDRKTNYAGTSLDEPCKQKEWWQFRTQDTGRRPQITKLLKKKMSFRCQI